MCPGELGHEEMGVVLYVLDEVWTTVQRSILKRLSCLSFSGACVGEAWGHSRRGAAGSHLERTKLGS